MVSSQNEEDLLLLFFGEKRVSFIFLATIGECKYRYIYEKTKSLHFWFLNISVQAIEQKGFTALIIR